MNMTEAADSFTAGFMTSLGCTIDTDKNKIHAIVYRNRDSYESLKNLSDIFGNTGKTILGDTKIVHRGLPERIRVDNGPEFVSKALDMWSY